MVTHSLSHTLPPLSCHSLGHRDGSLASGLNTEDPAGLVSPAALVQHKLGDLCDKKNKELMAEEGRQGAGR